MPGIGIGIGIHRRSGGAAWTPVEVTSLAAYPSGDSIAVTWIDAAGSDGVKIYLSTDGGTNYTLNSTVASGTQYKRITGLLESQAYKVKVVAYKSGTSSSGEVVDITTTVEEFIITIDTEKAGSATKTFVLPTYGSGYDAYIDWGDGSAEQNITGTPGNVTKVYATTGVKTIKIRGIFPQILFGNTGDKLKLITIENWGNIQWSAFNDSFSGCANLTSNYTDVPETSAVLNMSGMFRFCSKFNGEVNFNTRNVTNMSLMFSAAVLFNKSVSTFDTSKVTTMSNMFYQANAFNQSVSNFNTSNVTDMAQMFRECYVFNQSVNGFDTSKVTDMHAMFLSCRAFNQPLSNWNTSNVTDMGSLVRDCWIFNQSLSNFDTSKVIYMSSFFYNAYVFNQPISNFDTSNVISMAEFFREAHDFNQDISNLISPNVTNMSYMFYQARAFNHSVASLDTSKVTTMTNMFFNAIAFNQSVSTFDTSNVTDMSAMFYQATSFNQSLANFNTSKVTDMTSMLRYALAFNQSVANFDTSKAINLLYMFYQSTAFKQSLATFSLAVATNITNICGSCNINTTGSTANYDATLIAWAAQTVASGLTTSFGTSKYSAGAAETARGILTSAPNSWNITDGGM